MLHIDQKGVHVGRVRRPELKMCKEIGRGRCRPENAQQNALWTEVRSSRHQRIDENQTETHRRRCAQWAAHPAGIVVPPHKVRHR